MEGYGGKSEDEVTRTLVLGRLCARKVRSVSDEMAVAATAAGVGEGVK